MTLLAAGTALVIAAAVQTGWRAPKIFSPLLALGRCSYEIYLTHIFVVLPLCALFVSLGKRMSAVIPLFVASIVLAGVLGWLVAAFYSEPMNRWIRHRTGDQSSRMGAAVSAAS
jgi:peptidoglycan/LPS O-acetylase OafA/YrhL